MFLLSLLVSMLLISPQFCDAQDPVAPKTIFISYHGEVIEDTGVVEIPSTQKVINLTCLVPFARPEANIVWYLRSDRIDGKYYNFSIQFNTGGTRNSTSHLSLPMSYLDGRSARIQFLQCNGLHRALYTALRRTMYLKIVDVDTKGDLVMNINRVERVYAGANIKFTAKFSVKNSFVSYVSWEHIYTYDTTKKSLAIIQCTRTATIRGSRMTTASFRSLSAPSCYSGTTELTIPAVDGFWMGEIIVTFHKWDDHQFSNFSRLEVFRKPKVNCKKENSICVCKLSESYTPLDCFFKTSKNIIHHCDPDDFVRFKDYVTQTCKANLEDDTSLKFVVNYTNQLLQPDTIEENVCGDGVSPTGAVTALPTSATEKMNTVAIVLLVLALSILFIFIVLGAISYYLRRKPRVTSSKQRRKKIAKLLLSEVHEGHKPTRMERFLNMFTLRSSSEMPVPQPSRASPSATPSRTPMSTDIFPSTSGIAGVKSSTSRPADVSRSDMTQVPSATPVADPAVAPSYQEPSKLYLGTSGDVDPKVSKTKRLRSYLSGLSHGVDRDENSKQRLFASDIRHTQTGAQDVSQSIFSTSNQNVPQNVLSTSIQNVPTASKKSSLYAPKSVTGARSSAKVKSTASPSKLLSTASPSKLLKPKTSKKAGQSTSTVI